MSENEENKDYGKKQSIFATAINRLMGNVLNQTEAEARRAAGKPTVAPLELRRATFEAANQSFEQLCDLAQNHRARWAIYKKVHAKDEHLQEIIRIVEETVNSVKKK